MKAHVLKLRPTQFALGMREVAVKIERLKKFKGEDLEEFLGKHRVPVVISKSGELHLVDHHHLVRACWENGIEYVKVESLADLSHLDDTGFWTHMKEKAWVYLHDQFGNGPHRPELLPADVRGMADDPFRSLAWELKEAKGYNKPDQPFCEFSWADFLRKNIHSHPERMGFEKALKMALELCHHPEAKKLPGYISESNAHPAGKKAGS